MITTPALRKQAFSGDSDSQFRLGYRLALGRGPPRKWREASVWWARAASQGHVRAQFYLATCYDFGRGRSRNVPRAMRSIFRLQRGGMPRPNTTWPWVIAMVPASDAIHARQYCGSSELLSKAMLMPSGNLGVCLHEGLDLKAQFNLALCYLYGDGVRP